MKNKKLQKMIILQIIFFLIAIGIYILINTELYNNISECNFKKNTGYLCPACGGTRCVKSILKFEFINAFQYNQMIFFTIIYMFILNLIYVITTILNRPVIIFKHYYVYFWLVFFIMFTILRNTNLI